VELEERVLTCGGNWLYFSRYIDRDEEELEKLKKAPPKGLSKEDIQPVFGRAWVDLSSLQTPGQKDII